jgi:hypothetical protein
LGNILKAFLEFEDNMKRILDIANRINTRTLQFGLDADVVENFRALIPLSEKYQIVGKSGYYQLAVGEWLRLKSSYHTYGGPVNAASEAFRLFKEQGQEIIPFVRPAIKTEFTKLIELMQKILPYDNERIELELPIPPDYFIFDDQKGLTHASERSEKVAVESNYPLTVRLAKAGQDPYSWSGIHFVLTDKEYTHLLEDVYPQVLDILIQLDVKITKKIEFNKPILKEMSETVIPFKFIARVKVK